MSRKLLWSIEILAFRNLPLFRGKWNQLVKSCKLADWLSIGVKSGLCFSINCQTNTPPLPGENTNLFSTILILELFPSCFLLLLHFIHSQIFLGFKRPHPAPCLQRITLTLRQSSMTISLEACLIAFIGNSSYLNPRSTQKNVQLKLAETLCEMAGWGLVRPPSLTARIWYN